MKKRLVAAGLGAGLVGAVALCETMGWPFLRGPVMQAIQTRVDAPVMLSDDFQLRLIVNPGVRLSRLSIGAPGQERLSIDALDARWTLLAPLQALQGGVMSLRWVHADLIQGRVERDARGAIAFIPLKLTSDRTDHIASERWPVRVQALRIGALDWTLLDATSSTEVRVTGAGALGVGEAPQGFELQAQGQVREGAVRAQLRVEPGQRWQQWQTMRDVVAHARLTGTLGKSRINFDGELAPGASSMLRGVMAFEAQSLGAVGDALGLTLPRTPPFYLAGPIAYSPGVWRLSTTRFDVGESRLGADMELDTSGDKPHLKGLLRGTLLRLQDLGPAIGAPAPGAAASRPGKVLPDRAFDVPSLAMMDATVRVDIGSLDFNSKALGPLRNLSTDIGLRAGVLRLDALQASTSGGSVRGAAAFKAVDRQLDFSTRMVVSDVRVEDWVRTLQRPNASPYLAGRMSMRFEGAGRGRSTAQILGSLDGNLQAQLREGRASHLGVELAGLDVAQSLGVLFRGDKSLVVQCAQFRAPVVQGNVLLRDAAIDTSDSLVLVSGVVNLKDEELALKAQVKPKDFSPLSLRAPLLVGGPFSKPTVGVQASALVPRLLGMLALGLVSPPLALAPLLDFGDAAAPMDCPSLAKAAPARATAR